MVGLDPSGGEEGSQLPCFGVNENPKPKKAVFFGFQHSVREAFCFVFNAPRLLGESENISHEI